MSDYLDRHAQRLEIALLNEIYEAAEGRYKARGGGPKGRSTPTPVRVLADRASGSPTPLSERGPSPDTCHCITEGLRALRVMVNATDFYANQADFRCPTCRRLLDAPLR